VTPPHAEAEATTAAPAPAARPERLRDLSPAQWRSGTAAVLGWLFDGLDMHLYTLVATPFVAILIGVADTRDPAVGRYSSIIMAAFLAGWAFGGAFFGRLGDRLGRSRALRLTILTYAIFTGLSFFVQTWWQLMIVRFIAALGVGGEWAIGASLLSETWPRRWRAWIAAVLQTGVNVGILLAILSNQLMASFEPRYLFLVGILPAFLVVWIRRAVPEPEEWHGARKRAQAQDAVPGVGALFAPALRGRTIRVIAVCAIALTAHWAFLFWHLHHLRTLPEVVGLSAEAKNRLASYALYLVIIASTVGNFGAAVIARRIGYRLAIAVFLACYFVVMVTVYGQPRDHQALLRWFPVIGFFHGVFALFTMYLPPLFPTLLRTTGAGFCYNIGRLVSAGGVVLFGLVSPVGDARLTLLAAGCLFLPGAIIALTLPDMRDDGAEPATAH
jgi:MFS family permease